MHVDDNGEVVYDEVPVGIIPESGNPHLEYDEDKDKTYVVVNGYIFEEYSKAAEILEREQECPCSVELSIRELSYDAKEKVLNLDDFWFSGVTLLGKNEDGEDVKPGMDGSSIKLTDFSVENNSFVYSINDELIESLDKLKTAISSISNFNINNQGKEEDTVEFENNENLEVETTEEEIVVNEASEEVVEETTEETPDVVEEMSEETESVETEEDTEETEEFSEEETDEGVINYAVTANGVTRNFSVTLRNQLEALSKLVNKTYSEQDNDWYGVDVDAEAKQVYMFGWFGNYRQSYKVKNDVFSLVGDRTPVVSVWMSEDEKKAFDKMKADFAEVSEKLAKYEAEPEKVALFESEDYVNIASSEEFIELQKRENHFDMSVEEVKDALDKQLLAYAKNVKFSDDGKMTSKKLPIVDKKRTSRYGNLFKK